jgi:hypothetical protein
MAVNFDCGLAGPQFRTYLLVEQSGNHALHHFSLSRSERSKATAQFFKRCPLIASFAVPFERLLNRIEQILVAERLGQKLHGPGFHRANAHRDIAMASDEDNGDFDPGITRSPLQIEPT